MFDLIVLTIEFADVYDIYVESLGCDEAVVHEMKNVLQSRDQTLCESRCPEWKY